MLPLVNYLIAHEASLPPIRAAMYEYILAGNGLFVRGQREGLRAMLPVAECTVRGLAHVQPFVELTYPRISAGLVSQMLQQSLAAKDGRGNPVEALFHLSWDGAHWQMETPAQDQGPAHVQPLSAAIGSSYAQALIEVHSHAGFSPEWSLLDDLEETGFRLFGVLGSIFTEPALRVRVGLYGHRWDIPGGVIFDSLPGIVDSVALERENGKA